MRQRVGKVLQFLIGRCRERSTWQGLIGLATAFNVVLAPEAAAAIVTVGAGVASVVYMLFPEGGVVKPEQKDDASTW